MRDQMEHAEQALASLRTHLCNVVIDRTEACKGGSVMDVIEKIYDENNFAKGLAYEAVMRGIRHISSKTGELKPGVAICRDLNNDEPLFAIISDEKKDGFVKAFILMSCGVHSDYKIDPDRGIITPLTPDQITDLFDKLSNESLVKIFEALKG